MKDLYTLMIKTAAIIFIQKLIMENIARDSIASGRRGALADLISEQKLPSKESGPDPTLESIRTTFSFISDIVERIEADVDLQFFLIEELNEQEAPFLQEIVRFTNSQLETPIESLIFHQLDPKYRNSENYSDISFHIPISRGAYLNWSLEYRKSHEGPEVLICLKRHLSAPFQSDFHLFTRRMQYCLNKSSYKMGVRDLLKFYQELYDYRIILKNVPSMRCLAKVIGDKIVEFNSKVEEYIDELEDNEEILSFYDKFTICFAQ